MSEDAESDDLAAASIALALIESAACTQHKIAVIDAIAPYAKDSSTVSLIIQIIAQEASSEIENEQNFQSISACFKKHAEIFLTRNPEAATEAIELMEDFFHENLEIRLEVGRASLHKKPFFNRSNLG